METMRAFVIEEPGGPEKLERSTQMVSTASSSW